MNSSPKRGAPSACPMSRNSDPAPVDDCGFWRRWSRRKSGEEPARLDADDSDRPRSSEASEQPPSVAPPPDLPDIGSLDQASDFSVFMSRAVPDAIRNRALRRLWQLDPALANLDGLNDYDEDFTRAGQIMDQIKTAYRIGRGMVREEPEDASPIQAMDATPSSAKAAASVEQDDDEEA